LNAGSAVDGQDLRAAFWPPKALLRSPSRSKLAAFCRPSAGARRGMPISSRRAWCRCPAPDRRRA